MAQKLTDIMLNNASPVSFYSYEYGQYDKENIKGDWKNMTIETKRNEKELIVELSGRLDTITAPTLEQRISENIYDIEKLILDFKGLEYISSAGLRVVLNAQKKMQQIGGMKVINVCEEVMEVFEITGFVDILSIE